MARKPLKVDPEVERDGLTDVFERRIATVIDALGGPDKVAERFGVSRSSVWKWRRGKARPLLMNVAAMCAEAGYSLDWLVGLLPPNENFDMDLLMKCIAETERQEDERAVRIDPENKALVIATLYKTLLANLSEVAEDTDTPSERGAPKSGATHG